MLRAHVPPAEAEEYEALRQGGFVQDGLRVAADQGLSVPRAVLGARGKAPSVEPVAVGEGHRLVLFLDATLELFEEPLGELFVRCHHRLEIGVFLPEVVEHILIIDDRVALVLEPRVVVVDRQAMKTTRRRLPVGDGRPRGDAEMRWRETVVRHVGLRGQGLIGRRRCEP
jgi:hypothetical protein